MLVDENARAGGSLSYACGGSQVAATSLTSCSSEARDIAGVADAHRHLRRWATTPTIGSPLVDARRMTKCAPASVVVAAGAFEQPAVFRNNDLPGVMLASARSD